MKKLLTTALLALTAALTAGAQSRTEVYTFPSEVLGAEKSCTVYLPDGYDRSQESYPVLYLLHGASGCHTDWTQKGDLRRIADEAIAAGMARPMIVVMPDASGEGPKRTGKHMGYFDVPGWDYERFFFEEFMPAVEKRYRIASDKAHRAVAGLSMGGGGTAALRPAPPRTVRLGLFDERPAGHVPRPPQLRQRLPAVRRRQLAVAPAARNDRRTARRRALGPLVGRLRRRRFSLEMQRRFLHAHARARHSPAIPHARRRPHLALLGRRCCPTR